MSNRSIPGKTKGEATRAAILDHAVKLASQIGLSGLSIGRLAEDLRLSKSGVFAHFQSKEALQVQVLETAADAFRQGDRAAGARRTARRAACAFALRTLARLGEIAEDAGRMPLRRRLGRVR